MERHGQWYWMGILSALVMAGCQSRTRLAESMPEAQSVTSAPAEPNGLCLQRVNYPAVNLLAGCTSFELPGGEHSFEIIAPNEDPGASPVVPVEIRRRRTLAVHGRYALRISGIPSEVLCRLRWPEVALEPGATYTLSVFCRGGGLRHSVRLGFGESEERGRTVVARPAESWQRLHTTLRSPPTSSQTAMSCCRPTLDLRVARPNGNAEGSVQNWVEVDGLQLEKGAAPSPYHPHDPIGYGVRPAQDERAWKFDPDRPLPFEGAIRNNTAGRLRAQIVWRLRDVFQRSRHWRTNDCSLVSGQQQRFTLRFPSAARGYYVLHTEIRAGPDLTHHDRMGLAILDADATIPVGTPPLLGLAMLPGGLRRPLGGNVSPVVQDVLLRAGSPCCVHASWRQIETLPGRDDFERLEHHVEQVIAYAAEPVIVLSPPTPAESPPWALPGSGAAEGRSAGRVDLRQYRQFVYRLAMRFAGRVRYWHVSVNGDSSDVTTVKVVRRTVKLADPRGLILGPGRIEANDSQAEAVGRFLTGGGGAHVDIVTHDLWSGASEPSAEAWRQMDRAVSDVQAACAIAGRVDVPRWEISSAYPPGEGLSLGDRAAEVHRAALILAKRGVSRWLLPGLPEADPNLRARVPIEGAALAGAARRLATARFQRYREPVPDLILVQFEGHRGPFGALVSACPADREGGQEVSVPPGVRAEDLFGRVVGDGVAPTNVRLSSAPLYLIPLDGDADRLDGVKASSASTRSAATRPTR